MLAMPGSSRVVLGLSRLFTSALIVALLFQLAAAPAVAAPAAAEDDGTDPYLTRLLDEINARRQADGTPSVRLVPRPANEALREFLDQTAPVLAWPGPCGHQLVEGGTSWDYLQARVGFGAEAHGEVLACPGPVPYWTPERAADAWWTSQLHRAILYDDPDVNAVACATSGASRARGRVGPADAVLCVTYRA
jgi:hypothetical protein